jgi:hypothetical protein
VGPTGQRNLMSWTYLTTSAKKQIKKWNKKSNMWGPSNIWDQYKEKRNGLLKVLAQKIKRLWPKK